MATPMKQIIQQMRGKLINDTSLMAQLVGGVHSFIPEKPTYPYARIGDGLEDKFNCFAKVGKETTIRLYIYSLKNTDEEVLDLVDASDTLLDDCSLTLAGWTEVLCSWESTQIITEDDNRSRYAVMTYRVISQKN